MLGTLENLIGIREMLVASASLVPGITCCYIRMKLLKKHEK